jgi:hypothetical protein
VKVRAALVVDEDSAHGQTSLHRDTVGLFGDESALYSFEWVSRVRVRRRDELHGVGEFRDLERLLTASLPR